MMKIKEILFKSAALTPIAVLMLVHMLSGYNILYIPTASMEPTIATGSFAIAKEIAPTELKINDIAVYRDENRNIVHRIIDKNTHTHIYTFKRDNKEMPDLPVKQDNILFKVIYY